MHPTPAERAARGKAARAEVRRSAPADWEPAADRPDPVGLLEEQARTRVPELVPIRYGRMLLSPLAFFRGAAAIMAADLAPTPRTGLAVQLSGDAHLFNFGVFAASDRRLVFSLNDFDETLTGPFEWDVKRLVASFEVAGRERGLDRKHRRKANLTAVRSYRLAMQDFAQSRTLDVWYARLEVDAIVQQWTTEVRKKRLDRVKRSLAKRTVKDNLRALDKLTEVVEGKRRIVSDPPLLVPLEELETVLDLRETELELLVLRPEHQTELAHHAVKSGACALGDARGVAAPARHEVLDRRARLVALHAAPLRDRVDELLDAVGGQRDHADPREDQLLDAVA